MLLVGYLSCLNCYGMAFSGINKTSYCRQLRPVLIVLELAPLTPIEIKKGQQNHPGKFQKSLDPPLPLGGRGGVAKMAPVPEG